MDAVRYFKEKKRMTEDCEIHCFNCMLHQTKNNYDIPCARLESKHPEQAVAIVEKWSKEHPAKTRQDEFLERYPDTLRSDIGAIMIYPLRLGEIPECPDKSCHNCHKKYWLAEVEE